jgi:CP family cyanate transporter-like MFS transporter
VLCLAVSAVIAAGLVGLLLAPAAATLFWILLLGLGLSAAFPLALLLIVLRSSAPSVTSQLSAMVQGLGYLLAASGPLLAGSVHETAGSWSTALVLLLGCVLVQAAAGWIAGRAGHAA